MTDRGRRWLELRVRCPSAGELEPLLADALVGLGARGVEERGAWFVAYFEEPSDPDGFVSETRAALERETLFGAIRVEWSWQDHEEWAERWKRGLAPRRLTSRLVVRPSWTPPPEDVGPDDVVLVIDPGMAFGTAEHGTTRGSLRLLDRALRPGDRVLDIGAGSGILTIAAARLGAAEVVAVEGDALACEAMHENVERNGVRDRVRVEQAWATADSVAAEAPVGGILANIEAGLLRPLFPGFRRALTPSGWLVVSGILADEWDGVEADLLDLGFEARAVDADGEWRSGLLVLPPG